MQTLFTQIQTLLPSPLKLRWNLQNHPCDLSISLHKSPHLIPKLTNLLTQIPSIQNISPLNNYLNLTLKDSDWTKTLFQLPYSLKPSPPISWKTIPPSYQESLQSFAQKRISERAIIEGESNPNILKQWAAQLLTLSTQYALAIHSLPQFLSIPPAYHLNPHRNPGAAIFGLLLDLKPFLSYPTLLQTAPIKLTTLERRTIRFLHLHNSPHIRIAPAKRNHLIAQSIQELLVQYPIISTQTPNNNSIRTKICQIAWHYLQYIPNIP